MTRIWPFFPFYPLLMAPLNLANLALFLNLFALVRHLKSTFLHTFWQEWRGGGGGGIETGGGAFWQILLKYKKLIKKSHQYGVKWKKWSKYPIFGHF